MNYDLRELVKEEIHNYFSDPVFINEVISSEVNRISKDDIAKAIESSVDTFLAYKLEPMTTEIATKILNERLSDLNLSLSLKVTKNKNSKERTKLYE